MHVQNIKTPVLIQHGDSDFTVDTSQSYELYDALKSRKTSVHFIKYAGGHSISGEDAIPRMQDSLAWLKRQLKPN